jgi:hypothetical protein
MSLIEKELAIYSAEQDADGKKQFAKKAFLEALSFNPDKNPIQYTNEEMLRIRALMTKYVTGPGAFLAMECLGQEECFYRKTCPFPITKVPIGQPCPAEISFYSEFFLRYMERFDVNPINAAEVAYCNELAEIEILLMRTNKSLAMKENVDLILETTQNLKGQIVTVYEITPYLEAKLKLSARRERLIKLMVGDPQEIYKKQAALKQKDKGDTSITDSKKRAKIIEKQIKQVELPKDVLTPDDLLNSGE